MLERFTHNRRGEIIDVYTSFEWPTLCRAVSCLKVDLRHGKHFRENALPTGKIEGEPTQGRADVGDVPIAQTLGTLARKVLSSSRHAESRELARAVLRLLAQVRDC